MFLKCYRKGVENSVVFVNSDDVTYIELENWQKADGLYDRAKIVTRRGEEFSLFAEGQRQAESLIGDVEFGV